MATQVLLDEEAEPTITVPLTNPEGPESTEKKTAKELFENSLDRLLLRMGSRNELAGSSDFIRRIVFSKVVFKDKPEEGAWKERGFDVDKIVASWKFEPTEDRSSLEGILEIYDKIATENGLDIEHVIGHELGHALIESGVLGDQQILYESVAIIPIECHSAYIRNKGLPREDGSLPQLSKEDLTKEASAEMFEAWTRCNGTVEDFALKYLESNNVNWETYVKSLGITIDPSDPNSLTTQTNKIIQDHFQPIFQYFENGLKNKTAEQLQQEYTSLLKRKAGEDMDANEDLFDDIDLGNTGIESLNTELSNTSAPNIPNSFDMLAKFLFGI